MTLDMVVEEEAYGVFVDQNGIVDVGTQTLATLGHPVKLPTAATSGWSGGGTATI